MEKENKLRMHVSKLTHFLSYPALAAMALFSLAAAPANASLITFDLVGVTLSDGGTVGGSFVYNTEAVSLQSVNALVNDPALGVVNQTWMDFQGEADIIDVAAQQQAVLGTGSLFFNFDLPTALTPTTTSIDLAAVSSSSVQRCKSSFCFGTTGDTLATLTGGSAVAQTSSIAPEPSTFALGLAGIGACAYCLRRRKS